MEDVKCSVGELIFSECHKLTFSRSKGIKNVNLLSEENKELLYLRTEIKAEVFETICLHHENVYLKQFESQQKACIDPLKKHKRLIKTNLRPITLQQSRSLLDKGIKLKPGEKLCCRCRQIIYSHDVDQEGDVKILMQQEDIGISEKEKSSLERAEAVEILNTSLTEVGCSPLKLHSLPEHSKSSYGKRKIQNFEKNVRSKINKVLQIEIPPKENDDEVGIKEKASDMDNLVEVMKSSINDASRKKQIQILTIAASLSWSQRKIQETFGVSDYSVRQAQKLFKERGILAELNPSCGKKLPPEIVDCVQNFYQSDKQSRIMPGMKDVVSISKEYKRKHLILGNLRDYIQALRRNILLS